MRDLSADGDAGGPDAPADIGDTTDASPDADAVDGGDYADLSDAPSDRAEDLDEDAQAQPDGVDGDAPDVDAPDLHVTDLIATQNPSNTLSFYVDWRTSHAALTALDIDCDEGQWSARLQPDDEERLEHSVFVMGFYDGAECALSVPGAASGGSITVSPGPLPVGFATLTVNELDAERIQPGWTLFNLSNHLNGFPMRIVLVDERARVRWYFNYPLGLGGSTDVSTSELGIAIGSIGQFSMPLLIDWEGREVWADFRGGHHHFEVLPERDTFLILTGTVCEDEIAADVVSEIRFDTREAVWDWSHCEHWEPAGGHYTGWSHLNSIEPWSEPGQYLVSSRDQDALFLIEPQAETFDDRLVWVLGRDGDFEPRQESGAPSPLFWHQHEPQLLPDGNILLFDNGVVGEREFSRYLELALDNEAMTYEAVWEYTPEAALFAEIWGDADRLENGNTLGVFGPDVEGGRLSISIQEVTADGDLVWLVDSSWGAGVYRVERVVNPPLGHVVSVD